MNEEFLKLLAAYRGRLGAVAWTELQQKATEVMLEYDRRLAEKDEIIIRLEGAIGCRCNPEGCSCR